MATEESMTEKMRIAGVSVGTRVKTKFMAPFITTSNEDVYYFDLNITRQRIAAAARLINNTKASRVLICSGREFAYSPIEKFCEMIGTRMKLDRFMPGTLTNPSLKYYTEPNLIMVSDPLVDEQAVVEATNAGIPVIGIANSDNITSNLDLIIPANNRGRKSLAAIFWLMARDVLTERGTIGPGDTMNYEIEDFETKNISEE